MQIQPLFDNVLLKPISAENSSLGGLILPVEQKGQTATAIVASVNDVNGTISVGDKVLYNVYAAIDVKYKNESMLIVSKYDIIAVIK